MLKSIGLVSGAALMVSLATPLSACAAATAPAATRPPRLRYIVPPSQLKYADAKALMVDVIRRYPQNAVGVTVGDSDSGEKIVGLAIGSGPVHTLVVATHHGNEYGSTEVAEALAISLAETPIPGLTVYVIPVLNIGGYDKKSRYEAGDGRANDPNRDYPGPCGTDGPFHLKDTHALADFIARENIVTSATLHTYSPAVMYPWGISTHDLSTPYDDLFKSLTQMAVVDSHYETGNSTALLYPADGTFEDYAFWKHGIWSILFELGFSHNPSPEDVLQMQKVNVPGLRKMLEGAPRQRAEKHDFTGRCDTRLRGKDRRDE